MRDLLLNRWILVTMVIFNVLGSIYGYWWYKTQLASSPIWLWPIIPDSPLSSTFFAVMCLTLLLSLHWDGIILLGCLSAIKYGLWATIINFDYIQLINNWPAENVMLIVSHLAMAVEGVIYLLLFRYKRSAILTVALWFILNDFFDYFIFQTHPYLFAEGQLSLAKSSIMVLTVILLGLGFALRQRQSIFSSGRNY